MKIRALLNPDVRTALTKLFKADLKKDVAYKIKRIVISADAEVSKYNQLRASLIEELALKDEAGGIKKDAAGNVDFSPENKVEFFKRESQLMDMDVLVQTVKLAELGDAVLSASDLFALEDVVKDN